MKYIGNISGLALDISLLNISAIYRDCLHSLGTRSADEFLKVSSTIWHPHSLIFQCYTVEHDLSFNTTIEATHKTHKRPCFPPSPARYFSVRQRGEQTDKGILGFSFYFVTLPISIVNHFFQSCPTFVLNEISHVAPWHSR